MPSPIQLSARNRPRITSGLPITQDLSPLCYKKCFGAGGNALLWRISSGSSLMSYAASTEHRREPSEWRCSHSPAGSSLMSQAVFGLRCPSPVQKSLRNQAGQDER